MASLSRMTYNNMVYVYMSIMQYLHSVSERPLLAELEPGVDGIRGRLSWHKDVSLRKGNDAIIMHYALDMGYTCQL